MAFERISEEELASVGVELLDDLPGLAPDAMKAKFEETAKKLLAPKFNQLAEQLEAENAAGSLGAQLPDGLPEDTEKTVQAVLLALMLYVQAHEGERDNPHKVTADQAGAYSKEETEKKIDEKVLQIGAGDMATAVYDPEKRKKPIYQAIDEAMQYLREIYDPQQKNQDVFAYGPHLYKANFDVDGWAGSGPYTQTVAVTPVNGGPAVTANSNMTSGLFCDDSIQGDAQKELLRSAEIIDKGVKKLGEGTITCTLNQEKPLSDAEVYFSAEKGAQ